MWGEHATVLGVQAHREGTLKTESIPLSVNICWKKKEKGKTKRK